MFTHAPMLLCFWLVRGKMWELFDVRMLRVFRMNNRDALRCRKGSHRWLSLSR
ncbi:uncharacterized protein Dmul_04970 [Desulfococcus multivorans]|nr:uncharacterized protein Dmul_04970 [Desulfococcus multivorans]